MDKYLLSFLTNSHDRAILLMRIINKKLSNNF
jgi:hypothetical protein